MNKSILCVLVILLFLLVSCAEQASEQKIIPKEAYTEIIKPEAPQYENECLKEGLRQCIGNEFQVCGYYDQDPALDWSSPNKCPEESYCKEGRCFRKDTSGIVIKQQDVALPQSCIDECSPYGTKTCSGNGYQECGNFDQDSCSEWTYIQCPINNICQDKKCISATLPANETSTARQICQTNFKAAYVYLYDPNKSSANFERLKRAKAVYELILNKAGKGKVTFDLSYPIQNITISDSNRNIILGQEPLRPGIVYLRLEEISKEFYKNNMDDFDFIIISTNFLIDDHEYYFFNTIKNKIVGIGKGIYDNSARYGSQSKLLGLLYGGNINNIYNEEALNEFTEEQINCMTAGVLTHEITHQWSAYIGGRYGDSTELILQNSLGAHWFQGLDTGYDPVGGGKWGDNGDGTFTLLPHDEFCAPKDPNAPTRYGIDKMSDLTLYAIGAIDTDEVEPILWVNYNESLASGTLIMTDSKYATIYDIINKHGERVCLN